MMKKVWLASTLSLSLGVSLLAGCGVTPAAAPEGSSAVPGSVGAPGMANTDPRAQEMPTGGTTGAGDVTMPQAPAAPTAPTGPQPGAAPAPGAPVGGPPVGPGGSVVSPGIGGAIQVGPVVPPVFGPPGVNGLVTFMSDRATGGGAGFDIFVYDAVAATVLALPGVNTLANEVNPRLSSNGAWLVYQSDVTGDSDVLIFDLRNQLINTLRTLNTPFDETMPDISDDGRLIVYVSDDISGADFKDGHHDWDGRDHDRKGDNWNDGDRHVMGGVDDDKDHKDKDKRDHDHDRVDLLAPVNELLIYDVLTGNNYRVPVANRGLSEISWPTISGNGEIIAYGGSVDCTLPGSDIFVYSLATASQLTPPFINTAFGEYNPDLDETGSVIAFVSNRRGEEDIYAVDLKSGFTDNLVLANTPFIEQEPRWLAGPGGQIIFQSDRSGEFRLYAYDMATALLDTMPVANEPFTNTMLRAQFPELAGLRHFHK